MRLASRSNFAITTHRYQTISIAVIVGLYMLCRRTYIVIHFGIDPVENLVANRRNRFIKRYGETDNYLRQMLPWSGSFHWLFLLRLFNFCLLYLFIYFVLPYKMVK